MFSVVTPSGRRHRYGNLQIRKARNDKTDSIGVLRAKIARSGALRKLQTAEKERKSLVEKSDLVDATIAKIKQDIIVNESVME